MYKHVLTLLPPFTVHVVFLRKDPSEILLPFNNIIDSLSPVAWLFFRSHWNEITHTWAAPQKKSTNKAVGNYEIIPVFSSFFWLIFILQPFSYRAERWMHSYLQSRGESENNAVRRVAYVCVCLRWSTREREHVACLDIRDTETSQHNLVLKKSPSRSVGFFCFGLLPKAYR